MVAIQLLLPLSPSEDNFLGIDHHDVIAHINYKSGYAEISTAHNA